MKKLLILPLALTLISANFKIGHSELIDNDDITRKSTLSGFIKSDNSRIDINALRYDSPNKSDYQFGFGGKVNNETTELSTFANVRKLGNYSSYKFGLGCDLYYDTTWSPFIVFEYRSVRDYTREGAGIAYTPLFDKTVWPGKHKYSVAIINQNNDAVVSLRYKTALKFKNYSHKIVIFNISGEYSVNVRISITPTPKLKVSWVYEYEDISDSKLSLKWAITPEISLKKDYRYIDGQREETFGFEINV